MDLSNISFEVGSSKDVPTIAAMSRDFIESGLPWTWNSLRIRACLQHKDTVLVVGRARGAIAGFALMELKDEYAHLNLLAVAPGFRQIGLGSRLVDWLETSARNSGIFEVLLEVRADNPIARTFYRGLGYRTITWLPGYYQNKIHAVRMSHTIAQRLPEHKERWDQVIEKVLEDLPHHC